MAATKTHASFRATESLDVELDEPSDVVAMPDGTLFVVGDSEAAGLVITPGGGSARVPLEIGRKGESGFEGVAYDPAKKRLFVAAEEQRVLYVYRYEAGGDALPKLEARYELELDGKKNKGIEGLAFLPAPRSPTGKAALLIAREAKPRMLALLGSSGAGEPEAFALDPALERACGDFAGLALDPITGHVFVCSEESASLAEVVLSNGGDGLAATLLGATKLEDARGRALERVEGIAFDAEGALWVLLEDARKLVRYERLAGEGAARPARKKPR